ncbi:MAG: hypothetical protein DSY90_03955 [Deltaproteobacteria bacterium]|nr:MAG: hypothetical protein DSY90_03955 [Deltaproteobacteria bacterium]
MHDARIRQKRPRGGRFRNGWQRLVADAGCLVDQEADPFFQDGVILAGTEVSVSVVARAVDLE